MDPMQTAMGAAIAALAAAVTKLWLLHLKNATRLRDNLETRVAALEAENKELLRRCNSLEVENQRLLTQFVILSSTHDSSPLPQWVKDEDGKILACNRAYERTYLTPRGYKLVDYLHKTDDTVWPPEIAAEFQRNDREVWQTRQVMDLQETVEIAPGKRERVRIIKYPRYADGIETPIGIAGIAIPSTI